MVWRPRRFTSCRRPLQRQAQLCHNTDQGSMEKQDLLAYILSNAGILHCFLRDLWALKRKQPTGDNIFWLNEVPCTSITFVGIVVGTKSYENNTCIWIDDGSAVVQTKLPHKRVARRVDTKGAGRKSTVEIETSMETPCELPTIGSTVKVLARLEEAFRQEQPVNIRIKNILVCGGMEEVFHWTRVMELHQTKYSQPFVLPAAPNIPLPTISVSSTPRKAQQTHDDQPTPKTVSHLATPALSVSPESLRSYVVDELSCNTASGRIPRLRHPSRLRSSQLNLETFQSHVMYYMICMAERIGQLNSYRDLPPTKPIPFRPSQGQAPNHDLSDDELESNDRAGFGLGYLMRVPELQSLAIRVIKEERKLAEKRKILQERENTLRVGSIKSSDTSSRPKKQVRPGSVKKDIRRLFERVISNLYYNGAIVIEEGRSRTWDDHEADLVNSSQFWKQKNSETQSQYGESTLGTINEPSATSLATEDDLQLSDVDEREEVYVPVTPHLLHEPVLLVLKSATRNLRGARARAHGVSEKEILEQLKGMDARWDHVSNLAATLHRLEGEDAIWEVRRGSWVSH